MIFIDPTNAASTFLKRLLVALFGKSIKATEDKKKKKKKDERSTLLSCPVITDTAVCRGALV